MPGNEGENRYGCLLDRPDYGDGSGYLWRIRQARRPGHRGPWRTLSGAWRTAQTLEGRDHARNVVVEFPSFEDATTCYNSPAYQEALAFALKSAERDLAIVEGV